MGKKSEKPKIVHRRRTPRSVTLNDVLVARVLEVGVSRGEDRLSVILDECMRLYIERYTPLDEPDYIPPRKLRDPTR